MDIANRIKMCATHFQMSTQTELEQRKAERDRAQKKAEKKRDREIERKRGRKLRLIKIMLTQKVVRGNLLPVSGKLKKLFVYLLEYELIQV